MRRLSAYLLFIYLVDDLYHNYYIAQFSDSGNTEKLEFDTNSPMLSRAKNGPNQISTSFERSLSWINDTKVWLVAIT